MVRAAVQARGMQHGQTGTTATGTTAQLQQHNTASRSKVKPAVRECMGDTSVCYPWEYEDEVPTGTYLPNCHPGKRKTPSCVFSGFHTAFGTISIRSSVATGTSTRRRLSWLGSVRHGGDGLVVLCGCGARDGVRALR